MPFYPVGGGNMATEKGFLKWLATPYAKALFAVAILALIWAIVKGFRQQDKLKNEAVKAARKVRAEEAISKLRRDVVPLQVNTNQNQSGSTQIVMVVQQPVTGTTGIVINPLSLYSGRSLEERSIAETYAPYGRLISCELVVTVDSSSISTPIIGFVTEDIWHDGKLVIPAGAEVHGTASSDKINQRIAAEGSWIIVWRTMDALNGAELVVQGVALDMQRNYQGGGWSITDGSAGLLGDVIKSDNLEELKLFAATFISAAAETLTDKDTYRDEFGRTTQTIEPTFKNAGYQGLSAIVNLYAERIAAAIERDGFFVRVPAGKQFYLYVRQTIERDRAKVGRMVLDDKFISTNRGIIQ